MQDSLFLLPFFSKKVRQKSHLLHIFKFLKHLSPNVWFQSRKAIMYHGWLKKKTWNHAKERKKPEYPRVSAISKRLLWREDWKEKRKKVKIFACIFAFWGVYDDFWLWSRDIQFWRTLVFLTPACVRCLGWVFRLWRREGKKKCRRRIRKKRNNRG